MIIHIGGKVSDMFYMEAGDIDHQGYVPSGMNIGGGDYIEMSIDNYTGQIIGWKTLDLDDIKTAIEKA